MHQFVNLNLQFLCLFGAACVCMCVCEVCRSVEMISFFIIESNERLQSMKNMKKNRTKFALIGTRNDCHFSIVRTRNIFCNAECWHAHRRECPSQNSSIACNFYAHANRTSHKLADWPKWAINSTFMHIARGDDLLQHDNDFGKRFSIRMCRWFTIYSWTN